MENWQLEHKAVQDKSLSVTEGQFLASHVIGALNGERNSQSCGSFWETIQQKTASIDVEKARAVGLG